MSIFLGWMPDAAAQAALADVQHRIRAALPADAPRHAVLVTTAANAISRALGWQAEPSHLELATSES